MGSMSASDAAPLPRLGEVFFDVRGASRSMRLSWYANTGVAVFSIWQGGTCTGTFRLPIDDMPRMVEALQHGPHSLGEHSPGYPEAAGHPDSWAQPSGPARALRPAPLDSEVETGQTTAAIPLPQAAPTQAGPPPAARPPAAPHLEPVFGYPENQRAGDPGYRQDPAAAARAGNPGYRQDPGPRQPGGELPWHGPDPETGYQEQAFPGGFGNEMAGRYGDRSKGGYGGDPLAADYPSAPGQPAAAYPGDPIPGQEPLPGRYAPDPLSAEYPGDYADPSSTHGYNRDSPARPYVAPPRPSAEEPLDAAPRASRRRDADEPPADSFPYGPPPDEHKPPQHGRYPGRH